MKRFSQFPLFQSHIDLAHSYWKQLIKHGDIVIDATCGNGHDTTELARILFENDEYPRGQLLAIDCQTEAIQATQHRLTSIFPGKIMDRISLLERCHSTFPESISIGSVALIVYNLGYLPGGNKALTSMSSTTLQSLQTALPLMKPGGCISITCYPGHEEGKHEEAVIKEFASTLSPSQWSCCHHTWLNRRQAPSLLVIQKANPEKSLIAKQ